MTNSTEKDLFDRIVASSDAFYKHQQRGEEELTDKQRHEILQECFDKKKNIFVQRYEKYINSSECLLFNALTDPTSTFVLNRIRKRGENKEKSMIKNRRYIAMQRMRDDGDYFSDEKMREREPYLYDVMVGRYLNEDELKNIRPSVSREEECNWSGMLCEFEASQEIADRRRIQKAEFEGVRDTNPTKERISRFFAHINIKDDEEEEDEMDLDDIREQLNQISMEDAELIGDELDGTKEQLRQEFEAFMIEKFLAGKDTGFFDYQTIDTDLHYDDVDRIRERDEEEQWFDED